MKFSLVSPWTRFNGLIYFYLHLVLKAECTANSSWNKWKLCCLSTNRKQLKICGGFRVYFFRGWGGFFGGTYSFATQCSSSSFANARKACSTWEQTIKISLPLPWFCSSHICKKIDCLVLYVGINILCYAFSFVKLHISDD